MPEGEAVRLAGPGARRAAVSSAANEIAVISSDAEYGRLKTNWTVEFFDLKTLAASGNALSSEQMTSCLYGRNGRFLYSIGDDSRIHIWNAKDHSHMYALPLTTGEIERIAVTEDDKFLAVSVMRRDTDPVACIDLWELEYEYML